MPILHIVRGLPGSGKSTFARKLSAATGAMLIDPDALLVHNGEYSYSVEKFSEVNVYAEQMVGLASLAGADIIFADVLPRKRDVQRVIGFIHRQYIYRIDVHEMKISAEQSKRRNIHSVRPEDIDAMASAWEDWVE